MLWHQVLIEYLIFVNVGNDEANRDTIISNFEDAGNTSNLSLFDDMPTLPITNLEPDERNKRKWRCLVKQERQYGSE